MIYFPYAQNLHYCDIRNCIPGQISMNEKIRMQFQIFIYFCTQFESKQYQLLIDDLIANHSESTHHFTHGQKSLENSTLDDPPPR